LVAKLFGFIVFLGLILGCIYGAYAVQKNQKFLPDGKDNFSAFLPYMAKKQAIWLGIALAGEIFLGFAVGFIILMFAVAPMFMTLVKSSRAPVIASEADLEGVAKFANRDWLLELGPSAAQRADKINAIFADRAKTMIAVWYEKWYRHDGDIEIKSYIKFGVSRNLAAMSDRECNLLRIVEHLNSIVDGNQDLYRSWRAALLWGDGKGQAWGQYQYLGLNENDPIRDYIAKKNLSVDAVVNAMATHVSTVVADTRNDPALRAVCAEGIATITGRLPSATGGSGGTDFFLKSSEVPNTMFKVRANSPAIQLGTLSDGTWLSYSGSGALLTVAPPGSGKSQCHVIPNLLQWKAPAVVLDVKGEIYAATSKWRAANVGPVFRFAPTDPDRSHHYNPLAFVSEHPDQIWQESRFLTDMLIVPTGSTDQFWDNKAKELVSAAVAYICYTFPAAERSMSKLLDIIHGGAALQEMIVGLRTAVDVRAMVQAGTSLGEMNEKTRDSVLATVQTSFHGWGDAPVARVTDRCDWSPLDLRDGSGGGHPTVYICLKPREVEGYISVLRVFIAQHIRMLTGEMPTESDRSKVLPILFLLDELPRLREMPPVADAIEIGASYGLRVWMFAQSVGQLQKAYPNADGMIGSCAVRAYMNPSGADGLAEKLSEELGYVATLADGSRKRMVEASELAGNAWENSLLVLGASTRPARLKKNFAYENPELQARMGSS
jgi:type IV secretion system protein VirD4